MKRTKPAEMDPFFHRAFLALRCKATVSTSHRHIAFKSATGTGGPTASWSSMAHGDRLLVSRFYSVDSRDGFLLSNYQCQTQNQAQILRLRRYEKVNVRISCGSLILGFTTHCGQWGCERLEIGMWPCARSVSSNRVCICLHICKAHVARLAVLEPGFGIQIIRKCPGKVTPISLKHWWKQNVTVHQGCSRSVQSLRLVGEDHD